MFPTLIAGLFFMLAVVLIRREARARSLLRHLHKEIAEKQCELEYAEQRAQKLLSSLSSLYDQKGVQPGTPLGHNLADFLVQSAGPLLAMETVVLFRWNPETSDYITLAARGLSPQQMRSVRVRLGEGVLGKAAQNKTPLVVSSPLPVVISEPESFLKAPYLIYPLGALTPAPGLLVFCRPTLGTLEQDTVRMAALLAKHVELRLENMDGQEKHQRVYVECLNALMQAVSSKDATSREHATHCREWARDMAKEMHLPESVSEQIEYAAMLHDVGKLGINDALLCKPAALSIEEYAVVKNHPVIGHQMLQHSDFLKAVAPIVLYHHEWVNGEGYPEGLVGEEIPLGARMIAIIDAWDAMTTDQPYRKAFPRNAAIAELRQQAGTQFDPQLVDVFLHVIEKKTVPAAAPFAASSNA